MEAQHVATEPRFARTEGRRGVGPIVARAQAGDMDAYCELYRRYEQAIRRRLFFVVRDLELAEDLTQQTFVRLIESGLRRFRWQADASFDTWLFTIAHNLARDAIRYRNTHPHGTLPEDDVPATAEQPHELAQALLTAVGHLPHRQRQVVILHHLRGWSLPDIARHIGASLGSVHSLHFNARRHMKSRLSRMDVQPSVVRGM